MVGHCRLLIGLPLEDPRQKIRRVELDYAFLFGLPIPESRGFGWVWICLDAWFRPPVMVCQKITPVTMVKFEWTAHYATA